MFKSMKRRMTKFVVSSCIFSFFLLNCIEDKNHRAIRILFIPVGMTTTPNNSCRNFGMGLSNSVKDTTVQMTIASSNRIEQLLKFELEPTRQFDEIDDADVFASCEMKDSEDMDMKFCVSTTGEVIFDNQAYFSTEIRDSILSAIGYGKH